MVYSNIMQLRRLGIAVLFVFCAAPSLLFGQTALYEFRFRSPARDQNSYGELLVEIESHKAVAPSSDEKFDVKLVFHNDSGYGDNTPDFYEVTATVWIRAGQKKGTARVLFPECLVVSQRVDVEIDKTGGGTTQSWNTDGWYFDSGFSSNILWITKDIGNANWRHLYLKAGGRTSTSTILRNKPKPQNFQAPAFQRVPRQFKNQNSNARNSWASLSQREFVDARIIDELPETWLEYTNFILVLVSEKNWRTICRDRPKTRQAIADWVHDGGRLVVYNMQPEKPEEPDRRLLRTFASSALEADVYSKVTEWDYRNLPIRWDANQQKYVARFSKGKSSSSYLESQVLGKNRERQPTCFSRAVGGGRVFFEQRDLKRYSLVDWQVIYREGSLQQTRYHNGKIATFNQLDSFGARVRTESPSSFFELTFDIPGVGKPPVNLFRVLIFFFVLVIGPVNYVVLRRRRRLNLLLFTVPAFSFLTCVTLLTYAVLADGFRMHERIESVSYLDQRIGYVNTYSRHQCFGVSLPRGGYEFDKNTLAIPECPRNGQRAIEITDLGDSYTLQGGKMKTRTPHQFMLHSVNATSSKLQVHGITDIADITNQLGGKIHFVCLRDGNDFYVGEDIADGQRSSLLVERGVSTDASIQSYIRRQRDDIQEDYDRYQYYAMYRSRRQPQQFHSTRVLKKFEREAVKHYLRFYPHSYVVVLESNPMVRTCAPDAKIEQQLHVVIGIWK